MAFNNNSINIEVLADTGKAEVTLQQFQKTLQTITNNYSQTTQKFTSNYHQTTNNILQLSENVSSSFSRMIATAANAGFVFSHIKTVVSSLANSYMSFTDTLSKMSQRTGIAAESLGGLKFATEQSGANFDILTQGLSKFQQQLANAQNGNNTLGIDASSDTEEALMQFADRIKNMTSETQQVKAATEAFGEAGYKLLPMLQEGREGITRLKDEAKRLGLTLDEAAIQEGVKLTDATNRMKQSFASVQNQIISGLAPSMTMFFDQVARTTANITGFVSRCPVFVSNIGDMTAAVVAFLGILRMIPVIFTAIAAHPVVAVFAGIAVSIAAIDAALSPTKEKFDAVSSSMQKQREAGDELIATDKQRIERLKELQKLSDEGALNNDEVEEASTLVAQLTNRYGDLGIEIDATTGKISGMTNATKKMYEQMTAQRRNALKKELAEIEGNINSLQVQKSNLLQTGYFEELGNMITGSRDKKNAELDAEINKFRNIAKQISADLNSLDAGVSNIGYNPPGQKTAAQIKREAQAKRNLYEMNKSVGEYGKSDKQKELDQIDAETAKYQQAYKIGTGDELIDINDPLTRKWYEKRKANPNLIKTESDKTSMEYIQFMDTQAKKRADIEKKYADKDAEEKRKQDTKRAELLAKGENTTNPEVAKAENKVNKIQETINAKVLNGESIALLKEELNAAKVDLARTVATVSGQARIEARIEYDKQLREYNQLKGRSDVSNDELAEKWKQVEMAQNEFNKQNNEYNSAVGTIQAAREEQARNQIDMAKQNFESASRGTFNAWEVGSIGNTTAKEQLVTLKNMLNELIELRKNAEEGGIFAQ